MHAFVPPFALPRRPVIAGAWDSRVRRSVSATARPPASRVPPSEFAESSDTGAQAARASASSPSDPVAPGVTDGKNAAEQADVVQGHAVDASGGAQAVSEQEASPDVVDEVIASSKGSAKNEMATEVVPKKDDAMAKAKEKESIEAVEKADTVSEKESASMGEKTENEKNRVKGKVKKEPNPVKMSEEQIEAAAKKKEMMTKEAEKQAKAARERREKIFLRAQSTLSFLGDKTGVINLGKRARSALETRIDAALAADSPAESGQALKAPDAAKKRLTRTAATAFRSLSGALSAQWDAKAVPLLRERVLPPEAKEVDSKAIASSIVALIAAIVLLPALFSGGSQKPQVVARKELDKDTAALQRKLQRSEKTPAQEKVGPAAQKLLEKRARTEEKIFPKVEQVPDTLKATTPGPAAKEPAPVPRQVAPSPTPQPVPAPKPEYLSPAQSTPALVRATVEKSFGAKSGLITSATFDSLADTPTVVVELTSNFMRLSEAEQRSLAQAALQSARGFGFETVTLVEAGTGAELARAGVNIVLADENVSIRAQLAAMRKRVENLAAAEADAEAEREAAREILLDERAAFAKQSGETRDALNAVKEEQNALLRELHDAQAEIAAVPDREELEMRTKEAEMKSDDMAAAVETLSRQIIVARDAQTAAETAAQASDLAAREAVSLKEATIRDVDARIADVRKEVSLQRDEEVKLLTAEMNKKVADAEAAVKEAESALRAAKEDANNMLAEANAQMQKEIRLVQETAEKDAAAAKRERVDEVSRLTAELNKKVSTAETARTEAENALRVAKEDAEKTVAKTKAEAERDIIALKTASSKELATAKKEGEELVTQSEKTFTQQLDQLKKEAQTNMQNMMKEADARLIVVRDETKAAVQSAEKRERDSVKEANNARESTVKELRKMTRERDALAKQLERMRTRTDRRDAASVPAGSDVTVAGDIAGESGK